MNGHPGSSGVMEYHEMAVCALLGLRSRQSLPNQANARLAQNRSELRAAIDAKEKSVEDGDMQFRNMPELPRLMQI